MSSIFAQKSAPVNWFHFKHYIKYLLTAKHHKGYGIHSPFVFELVRETINQKHSFYLFDTVEKIRQTYIKSKNLVSVSDFGTGSARQKTRQVAKIARTSAIQPKYGRLLARLVERFKPQIILELGTSLGISTLYMSLVNRKAVVCTIEGCPQTLQLAKSNFEKLGLAHIKPVSGNFDTVLPPILERCPKVDFVFIDGNHKGDATWAYFEMLLEKSHNDTVLVFDDIYWSASMLSAWEKIVAHPRVTVSMDMFQFGIVFFRRECQKQHFVVRY